MSIQIPFRMFEVWRACDTNCFRYEGLACVQIKSDGQRLTLTASDRAIIASASTGCAAGPFTCYLHRDAAKIIARTGGKIVLENGVIKAGNLSFATMPDSAAFFPRIIDSIGFKPGYYHPGTAAHNTLFAIASRAILADTFSSVRLGEISEFVGDSAGVEFRFVVMSATKREKK